MVLWDPNFTPEDETFRVSFNPYASKTDMLLLHCGLRLPEDRNRARVVRIDSDATNLHVRVTDWKQFLKMATPEQVQCVVSLVEEETEKIQNFISTR